ncbi:AraC family transcriptional regulator [Paraburkholderia kururiensis]|uniref:AraC family transcriptional regulator n=1 Tax=Paraburkholderia kururiensis TaxID=984307 RepID=UPI0012E0B672|nr:AraC family transcriptional regulator [Paraburkholderia kururiensis]
MTRSTARERMRYWTEPALPGLSLLRANLLGHRYTPHVHEALVLAVTEEGGSAFYSRGSTQWASTGQVLAFNPMEVHAGHTVDSEIWRYRGFYLEQPALTALRAQIGLATEPGFVANGLADPQLACALLSAHALFEAGEGQAGHETLIAALGTLVTRHAGMPLKGARPLHARTVIEPALQLIADHYDAPITLDQMAAACEITPFRLIQAFRGATGLTPHAWLVQTRLREASRLLRSGMTPAEAALTSGFCDQSALNKHFVRCYGITPAAYAHAYI